MDQKQWLKKYGGSLAGKTVAITGATGDLGLELCRAVLALEGGLILLCRSPEKARRLEQRLLEEFPGARIRQVPAELSDLSQVDRACRDLEALQPEILLHNAGVYQVPRKRCGTGYDNIFQIDFLSPYYMTRKLLPMLAKRQGKVIVMGSIAHRYSRTDPADPDFSTRSSCALAYGNAKRYLMFAFDGLRSRWPDVEFAVAHPGITLTHMSAHHPPAVFALLRLPMKLLFPGNARAVRGAVWAMTHSVPAGHWAGPRFFDIWGNPRVKKLTDCSENEQRKIIDQSENMYRIIAESSYAG